MAKRREKDDVIEGEEVNTQWDIKKILIGMVLLVILFILASYFFLPKSGEITRGGSVDGALGITASSSDEELDPPELPKKEDIDLIINEAQDTLSKVTSENLTSSQAAIQKLIADLQKLQEEKGPGDLICELICKE